MATRVLGALCVYAVRACSLLCDARCACVLAVRDCLRAHARGSARVCLYIIYMHACASIEAI